MKKRKQQALCQKKTSNYTPQYNQMMANIVAQEQTANERVNAAAARVKNLKLFD
jgi:hypothetical protein